MSSSQREYKGSMVSDHPIDLTVQDTAGAWKTSPVVPQRIWFGCTDRFRASQWLFEAYDVSLGSVRVFPLAQVRFEDTSLHVPYGPTDSPAH